jgi:hypothetical protein
MIDRRYESIECSIPPPLQVPVFRLLGSPWTIFPDPLCNLMTVAAAMLLALSYRVSDAFILTCEDVGGVKIA